MQPSSLTLRVTLLIVGSLAAFMLHSPLPYLELLLLVLTIAIVMRTPLGLVAVAVFAPAPGVAISHFVIEPFASGYSVDANVAVVAAIAYLRLASLATLSVTFLMSLKLADIVAVSRVTRTGSWLLMAWLLVNSSITAARSEYESARVQLAFRKSGSVKQRSSMSFADISRIGIAMCLMLLVRATDIASMARGRGVQLSRAPTPFRTTIE